MLPGGEDIPLTVLYEDSQVLVADKPAGMVVHPGAGNFSGTLVHALLFRIGGWPESEGASAPGLRPGIVHRLDKDTSGVIITAKNPRAQEFLAAQFRERRVKKEYLAVVKGRLYPLTGRISSYLIRDSGNRKKFTWNGEGRGRLAVTSYRVLKVFENHSLVLLRPRTGRTHQLRVHMLSLGHPIAGDPLYSRPGGEAKSLPQGLMLHARRLSLLLPGETGERTFQAPLPERFKQYLSELRSAGL
jgi:23S rRNA pseudouridine1911/1915/1917 synthase